MVSYVPLASEDQPDNAWNVLPVNFRKVVIILAKIVPLVVFPTMELVIV